MVETICFRTQARTIDHLGREQIADCPTAISELWKNAYDAYARQVDLHIFNGDPVTVALVDNGHGMNQHEFVEKWLVLGTQSKAEDSETPECDRNGLSHRVKQGQKGIGRLSSAFLGPLLLVLSKRRADNYVAALIDWRLFENPFLFLQDIEIPVVSFTHKMDILGQLPLMFEQLLGNVRGNKLDASRDARVLQAWERFEDLEERAGSPQTTRTAIERTSTETVFDESHFGTWPVWQGHCECGTAMFVSDVQRELALQITPRVQAEQDPVVEQTQEDFIRTLSAFTDPYAEKRKDDAEFSYRVMGWDKGSCQTILSSEEREVDYASLMDLEHVVEGCVDDKGVFRGKVKAFGQWVDKECVVRPTIKASENVRSRIGPFSLKIATYEREVSNSTFTREQHARLDALCEKYAGFMIHRDGLRVMPYGRHDNDYFGIEERRGKNAGRAFWATRNMFGGLSLSRAENPNLKDKAGREGLIQNVALKNLREIMTHIFQFTADNYFGRNSSLRQTEIPKIREELNLKEAQEQNRKRKGKVNRALRTQLKTYEPRLDALFEKAESVASELGEGDLVFGQGTERTVDKLREQAGALDEELKDIRLTGSARALPETIRERYQNYVDKYAQSRDLVQRLLDAAQEGMKRLSPESAEDLVKKAIALNKGQLTKRMNYWVRDAVGLLNSEISRLKKHVEERHRDYERALNPILDKIDSGVLSATDALPAFDRVKEDIDLENEAFFDPYISALQSLQESIDLESLAAFGMEDSSELRREVERLNALAQLGITVEILGHELEGLDETITRELRRLPDDYRDNASIKVIKQSHQQLTDHLRFLSPLKLSGQSESRWISGRDISEYIDRFFGGFFECNEIKIEVSEKFKAFRLFAVPGKIFPVFINLVNNARYWVCRGDVEQRIIRLDVKDNKVLVSDNGPGVERRDVRQLFTLFFTRKTYGGRGVGLYLCRANLSVSGHKIEYLTDDKQKLLPGANFVIEFKGAEYGE